MLPSVWPGRWIVVGGLAIGLLAVIVELTRGESVPRALGVGLALALLMMGVCGVGQRFWRGDKVEKVTAGGTGVEFVEATEESLRTVNERVDSQMTELEKRVYALEEPDEGKTEEDSA